MLRRILPLFAIALAALSQAGADEIDELATALRKGGEALATAAVGEKTPDPSRPQRLAEALRQFTEFDAAVVRGNVTAAQAAAGRLEIDPTLSQPLRETAGRLRRELPALVEAREDAFVAAVEKLVVQTREQCLAAKKEAELQPLLREASRLDQAKPTARTPYLERAASKLKAVVTLVPLWMEYLAAKEAGNGVRLEAVFQQLAGGNQAGNYPLIPDVEIRRRVDESKPAATSLSPAELSAVLRTLLAHARTLQDIPALAAKLAARPRLSEPLYLAQQEQEALQKWFADFATATASLANGEFKDAWMRVTNFNRIESQPWAAEAIRLRALLVSELIAKSFPLSPAQARRPDENTADHLLRIARDAVREHRWEEVERIQDLYRGSMGRVFFESVPRWWSDPSDAISAYLEGRRLEEAGDAAGAVAAYLRVLRFSGEFVPTSEAQERLRALLAAQKTTLPEVRLRLDAGRLTAVVQNLDATLASLKRRSETAERAAQQRPPAAPVAPAANGAETARLESRLKKLEAMAEPLGKAAAPVEEFQTRLSKMEALLAPALESGPGGAAQPKVRLWLGPDFTVYRSAVPLGLDARLGWVVRFNGKTVLTRNAKREMQFNYDGRKPGIYTIYLTGDDGENPTSNVIDYTLTEEAAKKLGPRMLDDDFDRDGARNPPTPRDAPTR